jgi:protein-glutamine gamma-glutamyltransferase
VPFEQAFKLSSLLLAATAFSGLLFARSVPSGLAWLTSIILIIALLQAWKPSLVPKFPAAITDSPILWNGLVIGAFALFLLDLTALSRELLPAGIHFLVMLQGIKLFTLHQRRDYRHLYAISLMAIVASAALTTEVWYVPIFLFYLLTAVWTLLLYHLTSEAVHHPPPSAGSHRPGPVFPGRITSEFFWLTTGIAVVTFGLTLVIFFLLPRFSAGLLQKSRGDGLKTTGFSERVDLGMIGSVKENPHVVMRVELPGQSSAGRDRLYLRGVAFDRYNGRSWSTSRSHRQNLGLIADGTFAVHSSGHRPSPGPSEPLRQDILLEALDTSVLFAAPFADYLTGEFTGVQSDSMTGLHLPFPASSRIRYSVTSREHRITAEEREASELDYTDSVRNRYLEVPERSDQVAELARHVAQSATTVYEKTLAVQRHLLTNYRYSLDVPTTVSPRPIDDFLFSRKTGYCEHYATAMVIMLRSLGIPARLVTGFLATEWNEFGGYFTVRQRDAHAWVEVYFPHSGWVTMDPTPASGAFTVPSGWEALHRIGESLRLQWDRLFIRYSARDQLAVVHGLRDSSGSARDVLSHWVRVVSTSVSHALFRRTGLFHAVHPFFLGLLAILGVAGLGLFLFLLQNTWRRRIISDRPMLRKQHHIAQLYRKMLEVLARQGLVKRSSATPAEFVQLVSSQWSEAGSLVAGLTALYCRGRFSASALTREELSHAVERLSSLQKLTRAIR